MHVVYLIVLKNLLPVVVNLILKKGQLLQLLPIN